MFVTLSFLGKTSEENSDESEEDEEGSDLDDDVNDEDEKADTSHKESKAYEAMSSLVNYILPVR